MGKEGRAPAGSVTSSIQWAVHALGALVLVLTAVWIWYFREGTGVVPGPTQSAAIVFNVHPPLMILAYVVLFSEAALVFRSPGRSKATSKAIHLSLQTAAVILGLVALWFTWRYKNLRSLPHFYSLHSWLGLTASAGFIIQWAFGFYYFWWPGAKPEGRAALLPVHTFAGVFLYVYMLTTVTAGLQEKMQLLMTAHPGDVVVQRWSYETVWVNLITLAIYALGGVVVYSIINTGRPPAVSEEVAAATAAADGDSTAPLLG